MVKMFGFPTLPFQSHQRDKTGQGIYYHSSCLSHGLEAAKLECSHPSLIIHEDLVVSSFKRVIVLRKFSHFLDFHSFPPASRVEPAIVPGLRSKQNASEQEQGECCQDYVGCGMSQQPRPLPLQPRPHHLSLPPYPQRHFYFRLLLGNFSSARARPGAPDFTTILLLFIRLYQMGTERSQRLGQ